MTALRVLCGLLVLGLVVGCAEENVVGTAEEPAPPGDTFDMEVGEELRAWPDAGVPWGSRSYEITIENLTPATGPGASQVFSPPVAATHGGGVRMFKVGHFASDALAAIAEDGVTDPMVQLLENSHRVADIAVGGGPIPPGGSQTLMLRADVGKRRLSMAFMLVNTNDGFSGLDRVPLPRWGEKTYMVYAYDAGSEANTELAAHIPGPCCGTTFAGVDEHERIDMHPGILGNGDLDPATYGWEGAVARITVTRLAPQYEVVVENLTEATGPGASQVFSPPVIAVHRPGIAMFRRHRFASEELALIAEDAINQPMVDLLESSPKVSSVQVGGGVIPPGGSDTYVVETSRPFERLSMAFMLVNTNDGFSGVDRLRLPRGGGVSFTAYAYDAGSEANTELIAHIPGPCCGNPEMGEDEHERIRRHRGIQGVGELDPDVYGWDGRVTRITVTRTR